MSATDSQFQQTTRHFTISTAGHVDHGKTSLIRALTGIDPDRLKEEKERQMTTDLGFAHLRLSEQMVVGFVDVPGHGKFLKNMLAGVGGIDMALLVVAADEGPMPQTKQHVRILSYLGVRKAIVAVTKVDLVDDAEQLDIVRQEIEELLLKWDVEPLEICFLSSTRKTGIDQLKLSFVKHLEKEPARAIRGGAFLPIDRVFSKSGFGTVITGTLVKGLLNIGDQVSIGPSVTSGRIRRLETFGATVNTAVAGQRVAVNLVLKDNVTLARGHVVLGEPITPCKNLLVSLVEKGVSSGSKFAERLSGQPVRLYHGTAECHGSIRWVEELPARQKAADSTLETIAFIALSDQVVPSAADRFVVRLSDETIYGGEILSCERPRWIKRSGLVELAGHLLDHKYEDAILSFLKSCPQGLVKETLVRSFVPETAASEAMQRLIEEGRLVRLGEQIMSQEMRKELTERVAKQIEHATKSNQQHEGLEEEGLPLESLRLHLMPKLDRQTFQILLEEETQHARIVRKGDRLFSAHAPLERQADPAFVALQDRMAEALEKNLCLDFDDLAELCGAGSATVKAGAQALEKTGRAHIVNYEFVISPANLLRAHQVLSDIWNTKRNIAPSDFRETLSTTRKYAMALLQYFDDQKITRRLTSGRVLLRAPGK